MRQISGIIENVLQGIGFILFTEKQYGKGLVQSASAFTREASNITSLIWCVHKCSQGEQHLFLFLIF